MLGCLLEVLAPLRPDPLLTAELGRIDEDDADASDHPTAAAGRVTRAWLTARRACRAQLTGTCCCITETQSVTTLRHQFLTLATVQLDLPDFDAAALRTARAS